MVFDCVSTRDLFREIVELVDAELVMTDIHIEQDAPMMIKTPLGWHNTSEEVVSIEDMRPVLDAIDQDWEDQIVEAPIDRRLLLNDWQLRCNVYRVAAGSRVSISIRRLPVSALQLEQTGLPRFVKAMLDVNKGLVLVAGPAGSGKTSTLASMLDTINSSRHAHIITVEGPIEYSLKRKLAIVSQKEVPTDTASYSSGIREAMHQKPDVLMVGDICDADAADAIMQAVESGTLVLAGIHANNAVNAISKLLGYFPPAEREQGAARLANALVGVVFQSLLPSADGKSFVLASEMIFNHEQQVAAYISDTGQLESIHDWMRSKADNLSYSLNEMLMQCVSKRKVSTRDAMNTSYARSELSEMLEPISK